MARARHDNRGDSRHKAPAQRALHRFQSAPGLHGGAAYEG